MRSLGSGVALAMLGVGCGQHELRFPSRDPLWRDPDLRAVDYPCRPDPKKKDHQVCAPEAYESFLYWDLADKSFFRPVTRAFAVRPGGEATDVNSVDEVPDSSWFENRAGVRELTEEEKRGGFCAGQNPLPETAEPKSWVVDQGKSDGVTPGFRVKVPGAGKFLLKADRLATPLRASTAEVVGARLYWAAGFHAPCNFIHALDPAVLALEPGLEATTSLGTKKPFDARALADVLEQAGPSRDGRVRMGVSQWLPGHPLGPFTYDGVRDDDPLDVVPHEDRRELRGARLMAAWISHYDAREQNTMSTWMSENADDPTASPGHVKHWYLDFGDSLGTMTELDELSRRYGRTYLFDPGDLFVDFFTFGAIVRPWERATWPNPIFPYFTVAGFEPAAWKPGYPNPAFSRMTERDGAWMARILARIGDDVISAAVDAARLPDLDADFLRRTLIGRRDAILRRYLSRLSPIGNLEAASTSLCGIDLARRSQLFAAASFRYAAELSYQGQRTTTPLPVEIGPSGRVCVTVPRTSAGQRLRVQLTNGQAKGPLEIYAVAEADHVRLVGARRPSP